jgi:outer membrane protein assembly factor BamE (lipoprotein component of BamABCDE complex)
MHSQRYCWFFWLMVSLILLFCLFPGIFIRIAYGNFPIGDPNQYRITKGMTKLEVRKILGSPHECHNTRDGETWNYYCDALGTQILGIRFDGVDCVSEVWT